MRISRGFILFGAALGAAFVGATAAQAQTCRDPWITQAIREVTGRAPNGNGETGECTYTQYNNGRWSSYAELKAAVQRKFPRTGGIANTPGTTFTPVKIPRATLPTLPTRTVNGVLQYQMNGRWHRLIGQDGASYTLIGDGGGT